MRVRFLLPVLALATVLQAQTVISVDRPSAAIPGKSRTCDPELRRYFLEWASFYLGEKNLCALTSGAMSLSGQAR